MTDFTLYDSDFSMAERQNVHSQVHINPTAVFLNVCFVFSLCIRIASQKSCNLTTPREHCALFVELFLRNCDKEAVGITFNGLAGKLKFTTQFAKTQIRQRRKSHSLTLSITHLVQSYYCCLSLIMAHQALIYDLILVTPRLISLSRNLESRRTFFFLSFSCRAKVKRHFYRFLLRCWVRKEEWISMSILGIDFQLTLSDSHWTLVPRTRLKANSPSSKPHSQLNSPIRNNFFKWTEMSLSRKNYRRDLHNRESDLCMQEWESAILRRNRFFFSVFVFVLIHQMILVEAHSGVFLSRRTSAEIVFTRFFTWHSSRFSKQPVDDAIKHEQDFRCGSKRGVQSANSSCQFVVLLFSWQSLQSINLHFGDEAPAISKYCNEEPREFP